MVLEPPFIQILVLIDLLVPQSIHKKFSYFSYFLGIVIEDQATELSEKQECYFGLYLECSFPSCLYGLLSHFLPSSSVDCPLLKETSLSMLLNSAPSFLYPFDLFFFSTNDYLTFFSHSFIHLHLSLESKLYIMDYIPSVYHMIGA